MLSVIATLLLYQVPQAKAPDSPPIAIERIGLPRAVVPQYPPIAVEDFDAEYVKARAEALAKKMPFVVFIRCKVRPMPGAVTCCVDYLDGYEGPGVVVSTYSEGNLWWKATLDRKATDADIRREMGVTQLRSPFLKFSSQERGNRRIADDSWIKRQLPFLNDLEPYQSAKRVQVSFRRWSGYIASRPRDAAEARWNVAGGLEGVRGWSNTLYKKAQFTSNLGYVNGDTITWQPTYEDGAVFADVLRNEDGVVFEVRVAEKSNGAWERFVAYRDAGAFPTGYLPVRRNSCRECHDRAGETPYGAVAVPGGDTIFSHPIPQVESGETVQGGYGLRL